MQAWVLLQTVAQLPSQSSPASSRPFPQPLQSWSDIAVAPRGQQPSPERAAVMALCVQAAVQSAVEPVMPSSVHGSSSSQDLGQLAPSHFSPGSTTPLPHTGSQSLSVLAFAPLGQQPSLLLARVMGVCMHMRVQSVAEPMGLSSVQLLLSSQSGQLELGSQASPCSMTPLPHIALQSLSLLALAPFGQHWSPGLAVRLMEANS